MVRKYAIWDTPLALASITIKKLIWPGDMLYKHICWCFRGFGSVGEGKRQNEWDRKKECCIGMKRDL